jgi:hypothetical protein
MKLLTAGGLSYKRAHIVTGKISAIISECRRAVAKVRHERAARESAEVMAERRRILELDVRKYHAMDRRSVGSGEPPLDQLLANGVVAQRKYVRRQRNAEEGRAKEVERKDRVVSLRAASAAGCARAAAICYSDWANLFLAEKNSWRTNPRPAGNEEEEAEATAEAQWTGIRRG